MAQVKQVPVLIVGSGPVGLGLAADLGWRGVPAMVVEQNDEWTRSPRIMLVSVRTMEFCRRLGTADAVKNWGFPQDFPLDSVFVTSLTGWEIARSHSPSMGQVRPGEFSPEHQAHCPQTWFDPIWQRHAQSFPTNTIRYRHKLEDLRQHASGVTATIRNLDTDAVETVEAGYVVGCDGVTSTVRDLLGIRMRGTELIDYSLSVEFRTKDLASLHDKGNAGRYAFLKPEGTWATCMAVDGKELWRVLYYGDEDVEKIDVPKLLRTIVGRDFDFTIDAAKPWARRALVADRFQDGRVFLAGDSGHTHPPNGGFGMNTGMADAMDLGWKLAAVHQGWAPEALLDSYDVERRPIAHRAVDEAMKDFARLKKGTANPGIDQPGQEGDRARKLLGDKLSQEFAGVRGWNRQGMHLGYVYDPSPINVDDGTPKPADDTFGYEPNSRPGARAPHAWLSEGKSTLDLFGRGFVLLCFGAEAPGLVEAAKKVGLPLDVHRIDDLEIAKLYARRLVLVRPDGHVAWRGDAAPGDAAAVIDRIRGAGLRAAARVAA